VGARVATMAKLSARQKEASLEIPGSLYLHEKSVLIPGCYPENCSDVRLPEVDGRLTI